MENKIKEKSNTNRDSVVLCEENGYELIIEKTDFNGTENNIEEIELELEEASASLGASRWQTFRRVVLPILLPALLTGFALAFARAVGEYGSVIFIAGNIPMVSEITPLMIITKLEQYDYAGATAIASVMLVISLILLLAINGLQAWTAKRTGRTR